MERLNSYSDTKIIRENNINAAKANGVFEMAYEIASIFHKNNPVVKWDDRTEKDKEGFFSGIQCFGAITGDKTIGNPVYTQNNNPDYIYLTPDMQICIKDKKLHFLSGHIFSAPRFEGDDIFLVKEILEKNGYSFGLTSSVIVGS